MDIPAKFPPELHPENSMSSRRCRRLAVNMQEAIYLDCVRPQRRKSCQSVRIYGNLGGTAEFTAFVPYMGAEALLYIAGISFDT
jgi:hypothetical protein